MNTLIILISLTLANSSCTADVTPEKVMAMIQQESGGRAYAVRSHGAIGLMQVSTIAVADYNRRHKTEFVADDMFETALNIQIGIDHLCQFVNRGYAVDELIIIYWMGHKAYKEYREGKRDYLRHLVGKHLSRVRGYEVVKR